MSGECDNCLAETSELHKVGGRMACLDCYVNAGLPWYLREGDRG